MRAPFHRGLRAARVSAYAPGEFVGQESFMSASEILALGGHAGIGPGVSVLDLCCGVAGPGRYLARQLGCRYLGVDASRDAVAIARALAGGLGCRFEVSRVPPVPPGSFDVVLLLETMLAFRDKQALLREIAGALPYGGRFAFTLEEGRPLTAPERAAMPDADTVWLTPLAEMLSLLTRTGFGIRWLAECSAAHGATADSLVGAFTTHAPDITAYVGRRPLDDLLVSHRLWSTWLREGRVRKFAIVAEKHLVI